MRKSKLGIGCLLVVVFSWFTFGRRNCGAVQPATTIDAPTSQATTKVALSPPKPSSAAAELAQGAIMGTITTANGKAVAQATVCANSLGPASSEQASHEPMCVATDSVGVYQLRGLPAGNYSLDAMAPGFVPATFRVSAHDVRYPDVTMLPLRAGEVRANIDLVLKPGGVEVIGTVVDVGGGPVVHALVRGESLHLRDAGQPITFTDAQGHYKLWLRAGDVEISATADGYAPALVLGQAPAVIDLTLTPESTITGVVRSSSGALVAGAEVTVDDSSDIFAGGFAFDISDEHGNFRLSRLPPGRYKPMVSGAHGVGSARESVVLGLGQAIEGIEIRLRAATTVAGTVLVAGPNGATPCTHASVALTNAGIDLQGYGDSNGLVQFANVQNSSYDVEVRCRGYQSLKLLAPLVVEDHDQTGLQWTIPMGGVIEGSVRTELEGPVAGAVVCIDAKSQGSKSLVGTCGETDRDGQYRLRGIAAGRYSMTVTSKAAPIFLVPEALEVAQAGVLHHDVVLVAGGNLRTTVVDENGVPMRGVRISLSMLRGSRYRPVSNNLLMPTGADGSVQHHGLAAGDYHVVARGDELNRLLKPGTTEVDPQGEKVVLKAGVTTDVRLVVAASKGVIHGAVVSATGAAIVDGYVVVAREPDVTDGLPNDALASVRQAFRMPTATDVDGKFTVGNLINGRYTLRAYRKGGGEAILAHVAVGSTVRVPLPAAGSVAGQVRSATGAIVHAFAISILDQDTLFAVDEEFATSDGAFTIRDLPPGTFQITVVANSGRATQQITIKAGELKTGIALVLDGAIR